MINSEHSNYRGLMPDELPYGLSNEDVCESLRTFALTGGENLYITWRGSLAELGCIQKVFIYILSFFGLTNCTRKENLQYQFLKILYVANRRDLIKGDVERCFTENQIEGLLVGVSEAISSRNDRNLLQSSLYKFSRNHAVKPAYFHSFIVPTLPQDLFEGGNDFGITHLYNASQTSGFCLSTIESDLRAALDCISVGHPPSGKYCKMFVEIVRGNSKAFNELEFDHEELLKIEMVLNGAFFAFGAEGRIPEAAACFEELKPRLLAQEEVSQAEIAKLALLYTITDMTKAKEYLGKIDLNDYSFLDDLGPKVRTTFLLFLLQTVTDNFTLELFEKVDVNMILQTNLENLVSLYPTEMAEILTIFCQHTLRDELNVLQAQSTEDGFRSVLLVWKEKTDNPPPYQEDKKQISPTLISRALEYFLYYHGKDCDGVVQMAENLGLFLESVDPDQYGASLSAICEGVPRAKILAGILNRNTDTREFAEKMFRALEVHSRLESDNPITPLTQDEATLNRVLYNLAPFTILRPTVNA